jgi:hypothetical protein
MTDEQGQTASVHEAAENVEWRGTRRRSFGTARTSAMVSVARVAASRASAASVEQPNNKARAENRLDGRGSAHGSALAAAARIFGAGRSRRTKKGSTGGRFRAELRRGCLEARNHGGWFQH